MSNKRRKKPKRTATKQKVKHFCFGNRGSFNTDKLAVSLGTKSAYVDHYSIQTFIKNKLVETL